MNMRHAIEGIFHSPVWFAVGWKFAGSFVLCVRLVVKLCAQGPLAKDFASGGQSLPFRVSVALCSVRWRCPTFMALFSGQSRFLKG